MIGMGGANQIASLFVKIGADARQFENAMGGVDRRLGGVGGAATKFGALVGAVAVGSVVALGAGLTSALRASAEFEKTIDGAGAVLNATAEEMAQLSEAALRIGKDTAFSASAAAGALEMLAKNGLSVAEIMGGAADATVALAAATGANLSTAADVATDAMAQFGISAEDMGKAINGITGVVVASKFDINDYALALAQAGGVVGSFEDFNATIAATSSRFASGSDAGTSFKTFLQRLVPQTEVAANMMADFGLYTGLTRNAFEGAQGKIIQYTQKLAALDPTSKQFAERSEELNYKIGVLQDSLVSGQSAFFDTEGNMKSMTEIAGILQKTFGGLSDAAQLESLTEIFGTDAIRTAFGLIDAGASGMEGMLAQIANVDAAEQAARRLDNLAGDVEQLSGSFDTLKISIGKAFTPLARKGVQFLTKQINKLLDYDFGKWAEIASEGIDSIGKASKTVGGIIAKLYAGLGKVRGLAADFLRPFAGPLKTLVDQFKTGFTFGFDKMNLAGPLQGLFAALVDVWLKMQGWMLGTALPAILTTMGQWGAALVGWMAPQVPSILSELGSMFAGLLRWFVGVLPDIAAQLTSWGSALIGWIAPRIPIVLAELGGMLSGLVRWFVGALPDIVSQLTSWGAALLGWIAPRIPIVLSELGSMLSGLVRWFVGALPDIVAQLSSWGAALIGWIAPQVPALVGQLAEWTGAFLGWAGSLWPGIQENLGELWSALTEWVTNPAKRTELAETLKEKWTGFTDWAGGVWTDNIAPALGAAYDTLKEWITNPAKRTELAEALKDKWTGFQDWAEAIWTDNIAPALTAAYNSINDWIMDPSKRQATFQALRDKWTAFTDWAGGVWGWAEPKLSAMYNSLINWIDLQVPGLGTRLNAWVVAFTEIPGKIQAAWQNDYAALQTTTKNFVDGLIPEWQRLLVNLQNLFGPAGDGGAIGAIWRGAESFLGDVFRYLTAEVLKFMRSLNAALEYIILIKKVLGGELGIKDIIAELIAIDLRRLAPILQPEIVPASSGGFGAQSVVPAAPPVPIAPAALSAPVVPAGLSGLGTESSGSSFFGTGLTAATGGPMEILGGHTTTVNINITGDGAALPNDRAKLRDLARAIWREAEMSGMRL